MITVSYVYHCVPTYVGTQSLASPIAAAIAPFGRTHALAKLGLAARVVGVRSLPQCPRRRDAQ